MPVAGRVGPELHQPRVVVAARGGKHGRAAREARPNLQGEAAGKGCRRPRGGGGAKVESGRAQRQIASRKVRRVGSSSVNGLAILPIGRRVAPARSPGGVGMPAAVGQVVKSPEADGGIGKNRLDVDLPWWQGKRGRRQKMGKLGGGSQLRVRLLRWLPTAAEEKKSNRHVVAARQKGTCARRGIYQRGEQSGTCPYVSQAPTAGGRGGKGGEGGKGGDGGGEL